MSADRLQKILARSGYGSRRACETLIIDGRIHVNGKIATIGDRANINKDSITIDHKMINCPEKLVYIMLNKPRGIESTLKPQNNRNGVRELINLPGRLYPVGRLDADSEGLILLTNDGELTEKLTHARYGHEKEYMVLVDGYPDTSQIYTWRRGIILDDTYQQIKTARAKVYINKKGASGTWLQIIMREGRKRQIRRTGQALGLRVKRILRTRVSTLKLGGLKPGEWRKLTDKEVQRLYDYKIRKTSK
tara:strand:- start:2595 stop:3338 length:744 start_codon:yes stop_codon:yes gene_type:complete